MKTQFGTSQQADFKKATWTFKMDEPFSVLAGDFAIVPLKDWSGNPDWSISNQMISKEMAEAIKQRETDPENYRFWDGKIAAYEQLLAKFK
jgi:hypothetical protein